jgi:hypothetical protein
MNGQSYTFNPGTVFNMVVDTNQSNFDGIEIQNIGAQNLNLSWRLYSTDTLIDSRFELCNSGICFMNLPTSGFMPTIAPGATGWLKFHIISGSATGLNTIRYILKNGTTQKDTLTFNITVGNVTGLQELTNNKDKATLFPNPAQTQATIGLTLVESSDVTITILNAVGQIVDRSVSPYNSGKHLIRLDTKQWAPGMYQVLLDTKQGSMQHKLMITE